MIGLIFCNNSVVSVVGCILFILYYWVFGIMGIVIGCWFCFFYFCLCVIYWNGLDLGNKYRIVFLELWCDVSEEVVYMWKCSLDCVGVVVI